MSLLQRKPSGQVLISYSEERKKEMEHAREESCSALISLLKGRMKEVGVKVDKVFIASDKDRFADMVFEFSVDDEKNLQRLISTINEIGGKDIGVGKIKLFVNKS